MPDTFTFGSDLSNARDIVRLTIGDMGINGAWFRADQTIDALLALKKPAGYMTFNQIIATLLRSMINEYGAMPTQFEQSNGEKVIWFDRLKSWQDTLRRAENDELPDPDGLAVDKPIPNSQSVTTYTF